MKKAKGEKVRTEEPQATALASPPTLDICGLDPAQIQMPHDVDGAEEPKSWASLNPDGTPKSSKPVKKAKAKPSKEEAKTDGAGGDGLVVCNRGSACKVLDCPHRVPHVKDTDCGTPETDTMCFNFKSSMSSAPGACNVLCVPAKKTKGVKV